MRALYLEPATDWIDQSVEERLCLCAETLFLHELLPTSMHQQIIVEIRRRAVAHRTRRERVGATT